MKLATLNVCGLRKRSNYPDFFENFVDYDIVCFTEAKIDETDIILFPGFTAFYQPRKQKFLRKSGGIVVYVKDSLAKFVSKIESESDYVLWLSFSEGLLHNVDHLILGAVYIPPENSNFYNEEEIMAFENEVTSLCSSHPHVMLTGDFNSRTANQCDYIQTDDFLSDFFDFDAETLEFFSHINKLESIPKYPKRQEFGRSSHK